MSIWRVVNGVEAKRLEQRLARELSTSHPLYGREARAVARRDDRDDVAYDVAPSGLCVVHLTYAQAPRDGWPRFEHVAGLPEEDV